MSQNQTQARQPAGSQHAGQKTGGQFTTMERTQAAGTVLEAPVAPVAGPADHLRQADLAKAYGAKLSDQLEQLKLYVHQTVITECAHRILAEHPEAQAIILGRDEDDSDFYLAGIHDSNNQQIPNSIALRTTVNQSLRYGELVPRFLDIREADDTYDHLFTETVEVPLDDYRALEPAPLIPESDLASPFGGAGEETAGVVSPEEEQRRLDELFSHAP